MLYLIRRFIRWFKSLSRKEQFDFILDAIMASIIIFHIILFIYLSYRLYLYNKIGYSPRERTYIRMKSLILFVMQTRNRIFMTWDSMRYRWRSPIVYKFSSREYNCVDFEEERWTNDSLCPDFIFDVEFYFFVLPRSIVEMITSTADLWWLFWEE